MNPFPAGLFYSHCSVGEPAEGSLTFQIGITPLPVSFFFCLYPIPNNPSEPPPPKPAHYKSCGWEYVQRLTPDLYPARTDLATCRFCDTTFLQRVMSWIRHDDCPLRLSSSFLTGEEERREVSTFADFFTPILTTIDFRRALRLGKGRI